jgi:hypothetical protein
MNDSEQQKNDPSINPITPDQLKNLKSNIVSNSRRIAMAGTKTIRNSQDPTQTSNSTYDWWENERSFENAFWSVSYWDFQNNRWQIQVTQVVIQDNGGSLMVSYSIRMDDDKDFPGFQVYKEAVDNGYRSMKLEEYVLLDRILRGLIAAPAENTLV